MSKAEQTELLPPENRVMELAPPLPAEAALIEVIAKAASDPAVDIGKMRELLEMQKEMAAESARRAFNTALHAFQSECPQINRSSVISVRDMVRSRYATYEHMLEVVRPYMQKHGFSERFDTSVNQHGVICSVTCTLSHIGGHSEKSTFPVGPDDSGSKNSIQAIGSALSYGKRYSLGAVLGLVFTNEDNDGESTADKLAREKEDLSRKGSKQPEAPDPKGQIEASMRRESPPVTDAALNEAMLRLTPEMDGLSDWRDLPEPILNGLTKAAGWKKAMAKVAEYLAESETAT